MSKIRRYRLGYIHGSLTQRMEPTLEPVDKNDYIKVSELRELLKEERNNNICLPFGSSYDDGIYDGKKAIINRLLAALDGKDEAGSSEEGMGTEGESN